MVSEPLSWRTLIRTPKIESETSRIDMLERGAESLELGQQKMKLQLEEMLSKASEILSLLTAKEGKKQLNSVSLSTLSSQYPTTSSIRNCSRTQFHFPKVAGESDEDFGLYHLFNAQSDLDGDELNVYNLFDEMPQREIGKYDEVYEIYQLFDEMPQSECRKYDEVFEVWLFDEMPQSEIRKYDEVYDISELFDEMPKKKNKFDGKVFDTLDEGWEDDLLCISKLFEEMPEYGNKKYGTVYEVDQLFDEIPQREAKDYSEDLDADGRLTHFSLIVQESFVNKQQKVPSLPPEPPPNYYQMVKNDKCLGIVSREVISNELDDESLNEYNPFDEVREVYGVARSVYNLSRKLPLNVIEVCDEVCDILDDLRADSCGICRLFDETSEREFKEVKDREVETELSGKVNVNEMNKDHSQSNLVETEFEEKLGRYDGGKLSFAYAHLFDPDGCVFKVCGSYFVNIAFPEYLSVRELLHFARLEKCMNVAEFLCYGDTYGRNDFFDLLLHERFLKWQPKMSLPPEPPLYCCNKIPWIQKNEATVYHLVLLNEFVKHWMEVLTPLSMGGCSEGEGFSVLKNGDKVMIMPWHVDNINWMGTNFSGQEENGDVMLASVEYPSKSNNIIFEDVYWHTNFWIFFGMKARETCEIERDAFHVTKLPLAFITSSSGRISFQDDTRCALCHFPYLSKLVFQIQSTFLDPCSCLKGCCKGLKALRSDIYNMKLLMLLTLTFRLQEQRDELYHNLKQEHIQNTPPYKASLVLATMEKYYGASFKKHQQPWQDTIHPGDVHNGSRICGRWAGLGTFGKWVNGVNFGHTVVCWKDEQSVEFVQKTRYIFLVCNILFKGVGSMILNNQILINKMLIRCKVYYRVGSMIFVVVCINIEWGFLMINNFTVHELVGIVTSAGNKYKVLAMKVDRKRIGTLEESKSAANCFHVFEGMQLICFYSSSYFVRENMVDEYENDKRLLVEKEISNLTKVFRCFLEHASSMVRAFMISDCVVRGIKRIASRFKDLNKRRRPRCNIYLGMEYDHNWLQVKALSDFTGSKGPTAILKTGDIIFRVTKQAMMYRLVDKPN